GAPKRTAIVLAGHQPVGGAQCRQPALFALRLSAGGDTTASLAAEENREPSFRRRPKLTGAAVGRPQFRTQCHLMDSASPGVARRGEGARRRKEAAPARKNGTVTSRHPL